jgi:hypothetical protein
MNGKSTGLQLKRRLSPPALGRSAFIHLQVSGYA